MSNHHKLTGAGLSNVYLANGYDIEGSGDDRAVSVRDVDGLYFAIADAICTSSSAISPSELRFIRKRLEMSQEDLGARLGKRSQAIAKWETVETPVPAADGVFIKLLWLQRHRPGLRLSQAPLESVRPDNDRNVFEVSASGSWTLHQGACPHFHVEPSLNS